MQTIIIFGAGWLYAFVGLAALAWLSDHSRPLRAVLEHQNAWISNPGLIAALAIWPLVATLALAALWGRSALNTRAPL